MKRNLLFILFFIASFNYALSQDITITFAAEGESTTIDSVVATNLTTNESVALGGDESLVLHQSATRINKLLSGSSVAVFPNPFKNNAQLNFKNSKEQYVTIQLSDISGNVMVSYSKRLVPGDHIFNMSAGLPGLYVLSIITDEGVQSTKVIQKEPGIAKIEFEGSEPSTKKITPELLKGATTGYVLNYSPGDIISYSMKSGDNITVVNESPSNTKTITAEIVTCKDYKGINYKVVKIGDQIWMAENLKSTNYADGDEIPYVASDEDWAALSDDYHDQDRAYCYNDDYGNLYTWAGAMDGALMSSEVPSGVQGACPNGWHLPSYDEFLILSDYLGGGTAATPKLKETGTDHWPSPNDLATNESGFTALAAGFRADDDGAYSYKGTATYWWATNRASTSLAYSWTIYDTYPFENSNIRQSRGASVRCVKD